MTYTYTYLTHPQPIDTDILTHLRDHTHQTIRELVTARSAPVIGMAKCDASGSEREDCEG